MFFFYLIFVFFTIMPLFYIGGADLGNRATITLLVVLYLLVCDRLNNMDKVNKKEMLIQRITIVILVIASVTNFNEIYRALKNEVLYHKNHQSNFADSYKTFTTFENKECASFITNFVVKDDKKNKELQWILRK